MLTHADVHWIELDSVDSTNDYLIRAYQQGRVSGCVAVLAHSQTAGKGRLGRAWQAQVGASLCLSLGVPMAGQSLPFLPLCVGVAVAKVLQRLKVPVQLKWPNDLLLNHKKLGGVLCESFHTSVGPVTVLGLGINILDVQVPSALSGLGSTSLSACLPCLSLPSVNGLAVQLVPAILDGLQLAQVQGIQSIHQEFMQLDCYWGAEVQVFEQGELYLAGRAMGIDEQGAYMLQTEEGLCRLSAGDLSLRGQASDSA
jgi:BirA family biotin operon repressor/biotin-[acetyl-CoA-carboxylase] ligase